MRPRGFQALPPELIVMILDYTDDPEMVQTPGACSLARTCRAAYEPALDVIWETIPHPAVLFYTISPDIVRIVPMNNNQLFAVVRNRSDSSERYSS